VADRQGGGHEVPQTISHYDVGDAIGGGGMGTVYRGTDRRDDSPVAIKLLHPHLAEDESFRERFEREAHVGALLRSPYVVQLIDYGLAESRYFIVMEYVEGTSLKDEIAKGPLAPARALKIASQVARALEEAEARGVVHRDIKPDNILLNTRDSVKVADFGIAKQLSSGTLTMPGAFVGTLFYAAPELALGKADNRSDIYSLGATLFHLLTGHPPFRGDALEVLRAHAETPVPMEQLEGVPENVREIIVKCLQKDPEARYQTTTQLAGDLEKAATRLGQDVDAPTIATLEQETMAEPPVEELTAATEVAMPPPPVTPPPVTPPPPEPEVIPAAPIPEAKTSDTGAPPPLSRPVPPPRHRGLPSWLPAAGGGLLVAVLAVVGLVFLGTLGGDDNGGGSNDPAAALGRDRLRRMLLSQPELGSDYATFALNPDASGYVTADFGGGGAACPSDATATPPPMPVESYGNQYESEESMATESGTFIILEGVDHYPDEGSVSAALADFMASPVYHLSMAGCPENEITGTIEFVPLTAGTKRGGVEHVIRQTDADDNVREFTVTAVGFVRETILGKVLIAHFDSPQHQANASNIAVDLDARIQSVLAEATPTPSPSGSATATPSGQSPRPTASDDASGTGGATQTDRPSSTPSGQTAPSISSLGCSPTSVKMGDSVSCSPSISGTVTSRSWSASGGSPSTGSGSSFSTSFSSTGQKVVTLQACNVSACSASQQGISVSSGTTAGPSAPSISSLGCSPTTVDVGQNVSCSPSVSGTVTSRTWTASGGSPSSGSGSSFSTSYGTSGSKTITLKACNGSACDTASQTVSVSIIFITIVPTEDFVVSVDSGAMYSDETVSVSIRVDAPSPGLGEYEIDVIYNPDVITPLSCVDWYGGDCDPYFFDDTVSTYGYAGGATGSLTIATITFAWSGFDCCYSDLIVSVFDMLDANDDDVFYTEIDGGIEVLLYES
jgi:serine/threonine protein kinase